MTEETKIEETKPAEGAFVSSLKRNNKQIKDDRATSIAEDAETAYRRCIEDLIADMRRMRRDRVNMLDLSPENTFSLMLGKDFDGKKFVEADTKIGLNLRNMEIQLELMQWQYEHLFGRPAPQLEVR
jgi:hypothetical protein